MMLIIAEVIPLLVLAFRRKLLQKTESATLSHYKSVFISNLVFIAVIFRGNKRKLISPFFDTRKKPWHSNILKSPSLAAQVKLGMRFYFDWPQDKSLAKTR